jgi:hypothetical protein
MINLSDAKMCSKGCGAMVYFDKNSTVGHPSPDKWVPLEIKEGRKTDVAHNCPKRYDSAGTLDSSSSSSSSRTTTTPADSLKFAESLLEILADYIRLKTKEQGAATK